MKAKRKYPNGQDAVEKRAFACNLEIRGSDQGTTIEGYAAVFDALSEDLGGFREIIAGGSFKRTLKAGADVRALVDHDPGKILGRTKAGTLTLREDDHGLKVRIKPPDTTAGRDTVESLRRGDLDQMSFAFSVVSDSWDTIDGVEVRTIADVDLHDVSVVAYPAYLDTSVALRSRRRNVNPYFRIELERQRAYLAKMETRGALSKMLNDLAEGMVGDDASMADIIKQLGTAAGIEAGTVNDIMSGGIECPPRNRLAGFARVLGVSTSRLITAAERDGCDYSEQNSRCLPCDAKQKRRLT